MRRYWIIAGLCAALIALLDLAGQFGWINANPSGSVPVGLYVKASPETAEYVSFCLAPKHQVLKFYDHFCSPDNPGGTRILKRIVERRADGSLIVRGDIAFAIDSQILGPIFKDQISGFWNPLLVWAEAQMETHKHG